MLVEIVFSVIAGTAVGLFGYAMGRVSVKSAMDYEYERGMVRGRAEGRLDNIEAYDDPTYRRHFLAMQESAREGQ